MTFTCDGCGCRIGDYDFPVKGPNGEMLCEAGCTPPEKAEDPEPTELEELHDEMMHWRSEAVHWKSAYEALFASNNSLAAENCRLRDRLTSIINIARQ